ncbi:MAG: hypothetical protein JWQ16_858 [Novosphingobium sp.]|nr:hypothetical protein [Novosphingobium sp.]
MIARASTFVALLLVAGCAGPAGPCNIPAEPALPPAADECGAAGLSRYLNVVPSGDMKSAIASAIGDRTIRYIAPGDAVTMDFVASRVNAELGDDGRITRFRCG